MTVIVLVIINQIHPSSPQVDGPSHFIAAAGGGRRASGATALKRRLLARAGWRVVSVAHWEWEACAAPPQQRDYLRRLLQAPPAPAAPPPPRPA